MNIDTSKIPVFKCRQCGNCCRMFDPDGKVKQHEGQFIGGSLLLQKTALFAIYDWEIPYLKEQLAKNNSSMQIVPSSLFFDMKNNQAIIQQYTLDGDHCPFLKNNQCSIYENRPIFCRSFPCKVGNEIGDTVHFETYAICPADSKDGFLECLTPYINSTLSRANIEECIQHRYGDAYLYKKMSEVHARICAKLFHDLEEAGEIKLAKRGYDLKFLWKRVSMAKQITMSDLIVTRSSEHPRRWFDLDRVREAFLNGRKDE